jgi:hypothetical protein
VSTVSTCATGGTGRGNSAGGTVAPGGVRSTVASSPGGGLFAIARNLNVKNNDTAIATSPSTKNKAPMVALTAEKNIEDTIRITPVIDVVITIRE